MAQEATKAGEPRVRVAALGDGRVTLWDVASGASRVIGDAEAPVLAVALAPGGERVASGGTDGRLKVSDWSGAGLHSFTGHAAPIQAIRWASDGSSIATGDEAGHVIVWELADNTHRELGVLPSRVRALEFDLARQELVALGSGQGGVAYSLARTASKPRALPKVTALRVAGRTRLQLAGGVATLAFAGAPDRGLLGEGLGQAIDLDASGRWAALLRAGAVEVWDASPRLARTLTQPGHRLERLVFSPSGRWLAGASADGAVHLWSVADDTRVLVRAAGPREPRATRTTLLRPRAGRPSSASRAA